MIYVMDKNFKIVKCLATRKRDLWAEKWPRQMPTHVQCREYTERNLTIDKSACKSERGQESPENGKKVMKDISLSWKEISDKSSPENGRHKNRNKRSQLRGGKGGCVHRGKGGTMRVILKSSTDSSWISTDVNSSSDSPIWIFQTTKSISVKIMSNLSQNPPCVCPHHVSERNVNSSRLSVHFGFGGYLVNSTPSTRDLLTVCVVLWGCGTNHVSSFW